MSFGNSVENSILDEVFGGTAYGAIGTLYVAVSTASFGEAGTGGSEPSGGEYARVVVVNNGTNWSAAVSGTKQNAVAFTFATATSNWGTIAHMGIFGTALPTTGTFVAYGTLDTAKVVTTNDVFRFSVGSLTITLT